jgi:hypothetical protein
LRVATLVVVVASVAQAHEGHEPFTHEGHEPFTIVALPDTQNYVNSATNAPLFTQQTQWIANQIQVAGNPRNIQFVTHLGDVVSSGSSLTEWQRADAAMDLLDGVVKYSVLPGNHDFASTGNKSAGAANYVANFGPQRFAGYAWYGGSDPSGLNSFQRFSAGGFDFIHLAMEWHPTLNVPLRETAPIQWAQSVIDAHPNTPVIFSTHEHIDDSPPGRSAVGEALWNQFIRHNDQIFLALNGHFHSVGGTNDGEYHQVSMNDANRPVFEVLQDFQDYPNGGDGWLRLINFDIPNNQIAFETYSPVLNQFQTERVDDVGPHASQFELAIDFLSRLTPVIIPPPPPPPVPDLVFQNGLSGYAGAQDKELRSSGGDAGNGQADQISIDGDDGSPGLQPTHGLIRFDNIIGTGPGQLSPDAHLERAVLVLEVADAGSGFTVHEMLGAWDESSTWQGLGGGVQPDGVEAVAIPIAAFGADNSGANVSGGVLHIDVTETIEGYLNGSLANRGWAMLPYANGTNGVDFFSSEYAQIALRPQLQVFLELPGDFNHDGAVDGADFLVWQRGLGGSHSAATLAVWRAHFGETAGSGAEFNAAAPEPTSAWLLLLGAGACPSRRKNNKRHFGLD